MPGSCEAGNLVASLTACVSLYFHLWGVRDELLVAGLPTLRELTNSSENREERERTACCREFPCETQTLEMTLSSTHSQNMPSQNDDEVWMQRALAEAKSAQESGEVPVGAVIVQDGALVAVGQNRNLRDHDPSAHAEIVALRAAGAALGNHRLEGCEMYVIIEPCAMCSGALVHARLKRLIYGAKDPKAGAVESAMQVLNHPKLNHHMEVTGGVLEEQCSRLLREFFKQRRATPG